MSLKFKLFSPLPPISRQQTRVGGKHAPTKGRSQRGLLGLYSIYIYLYLYIKPELDPQISAHELLVAEKFVVRSIQCKYFVWSLGCLLIGTRLSTSDCLLNLEYNAGSGLWSSLYFIKDEEWQSTQLVGHGVGGALWPLWWWDLWTLGCGRATYGTAKNWGRHRCRCLSCVYRLLLAQPRTLNGARVLVLPGGVWVTPSACIRLP